MKKYDLSVIIMARNEAYLARTVEEVLTKRRGNTEIIVILDGAWADPAIPDYEDVTIVYHSTSIGQRASLNEGARISQAKFIMKLDAHCALDEGFDVKLMADCEYDWTVVPTLYNLHVFDWHCKKCGNKWYQGPTPTHCFADYNARIPNEKCDGKEFEKVMVWQPRWNRKTYFMRFDKDLHFQYWGDLANRPESKGDIADTMSLLGACFFLHRQRYWDLGGSDEEHGSWGQQGTEIACKSWLSGGRLVVNKKTWYSHLFRTQGGDFGFPYPLSGNQVQHARDRSRELWLGNNFDKQIRPLSWLIEKFWPIPGWEEKDLKEVQEAGKKFNSEIALVELEPRVRFFESTNDFKSKGIIYYTDNQLTLKISHRVQKQLKKIGLPIVSASLKPMDFGKNVHLNLKRGYLTMARQILSALEASDSEIIFFCEHDVLYHPSHFNFTPEKKDVYYYNVNVWKVRSSDGHAVKVDDCKQLSGLCGYRETLIKHFQKRLAMLEAKWSEISERDYTDEEIDKEFNAYVRAMGFEPGTHRRDERVDDLGCESWSSEYPNVDIRHDSNLTSSRWSPDQFRNKKFTQGWTEADNIPGWGVTKGRFWEFLSEI